MTSKIRLKRSGTTGAQPNPASLEYGEITLNYADSTIYFRKVDDTLGSITTSAGGGGGGALRSVTTVNVSSTQTVFSVTGGYTVGAIDVFRNGIKLLPSLDFTATNGTSVTLVIAAENGDVVELLAYNVQTLVSTVARTVTTITATSGQTTFTATGGYTPGYADVYQNGVRLVETDDFTASNGTTVVLTVGAVVGDVVDIVAHTVHGLADGYTTTQADARFQLSSEKGAANGYASLDGAGKVPSSQLPSYVDDILEYATLANFPATGVAGVIYVDTTANKTYRWGGSSYVEVSAGPSTTDALSEGSTNLYYTDERAQDAAAGLFTSGTHRGTTFTYNDAGNLVDTVTDTLYAYVTNADSVTINRGQPVYLFGSQGDRATVKLAQNTGDATSAKTVGLVADATIASGQAGYIIVRGVLKNVDTSMYTAGDTLYLGSTAGSLTTTKPYAPNHLVYLGVVEKTNQGGGQIYVITQNGYELDEIHDVDVTTTPPQALQFLRRNAGNTLWINSSLTSSDVSTALGYTPYNSSNPSGFISIDSAIAMAIALG